VVSSNEIAYELKPEANEHSSSESVKYGNRESASFAENPTVLASATFHPLLSFTGRPLEYREELLTFSIVPSDRGGWAVFSWSKKAPKNASLMVKSFTKLPREVQTTALVNLVFETTENHAFSPTWWTGLPTSRQQRLLKRFGRCFRVGDDKPPADALVVSEKPWIDWQPISSGYV
jgi:hypothetical protein